MIVTSYAKYPEDESYKSYLSKTLEQYQKFRKMYVVDPTAKKQRPGPFDFSFTMFDPPKLNLKFVRIYFDAKTLDKITKDRAAKFVDMLSAIGGTMGLLTGFSIISGVEIVYFAAKIIFRLTFNEKKYLRNPEKA